MSSDLLLDTCAAIWLAEGMTMSQDAMTALAQAARDQRVTKVSPITGWEIGLLASKGRLTLRTTPHRWFHQLCALPGMALAEMSPDMLVDSSFLPGDIHADPADRILVATARALGLSLVTRDQKIIDYAAQGHVSVITC